MPTTQPTKTLNHPPITWAISAGRIRCTAVLRGLACVLSVTGATWKGTIISRHSQILLDLEDRRAREEVSRPGGVDQPEGDAMSLSRTLHGLFSASQGLVS